MALTINISSQIVVQTAAQWAADTTVYSAKRILVTSDVMYTGTDQRKFKLADGAQTWANLDYVPIFRNTVSNNVVPKSDGTDLVNSPIQCNPSQVYIEEDSFYFTDGLAAEIFADSTQAYMTIDQVAQKYIVIQASDISLAHDAQINLASPNINLPNETASRYLFLDASKNIDVKTTAQVLSDIGAQPLDADLTAIAAMAPATGDTIYYSGGWTLKSYQGYGLNLGMPGASPADATTYYFGGSNNAANNTTDGFAEIIIPKAGTIKAVTINASTGVVGSGETSSIYVRHERTTDTLITSSMINNASIAEFSNTALNIAVAVGDSIQIKWITPTWVTNPTTVRMNFLIYIE